MEPCIIASVQVLRDFVARVEDEDGTTVVIECDEEDCSDWAVHASEHADGPIRTSRDFELIDLRNY